MVLAILVYHDTNIGINCFVHTSGNFHKFSEIVGNIPKSSKKGEYLVKFGSFWELLGTFGIRNWERDLGPILGDIPASEETVTELRRVILAMMQGISRTDVH